MDNLPTSNVSDYNLCKWFVKLPPETFCNEDNVIEPIWSTGALSMEYNYSTFDIIWDNHPSTPEFQNTFSWPLKGKKLVCFEFNSGEEIINETDFFVAEWAV